MENSKLEHLLFSVHLILLDTVFSGIYLPRIKLYL